MVAHKTFSSFGFKPTHVKKNTHRNVNLHKNDWIAYCHCDPKLPYTRNLVATDDETYTLLLLCWNPQQTSPIHDHPYDGCWMRVVQGHIREERFIANETMYRTHDQMFGVGQLLFMEDSLGYHRVSNPSKSDLAVTLHLYCPPYQQCKTWSHEEQLQPKIGNIHHYSEYGKKL